MGLLFNIFVDDVPERKTVGAGVVEFDEGVLVGDNFNRFTFKKVLADLQKV